MILNAAAKVNLSLQITGKREDGYHNLSSLVTFTEFGDQIEMVDAGQLEIYFSGPFASGLVSDQNSVVNAVKWFETHHNLTVKKRISVYKSIPVMGGLGGGTADCAAMIHALCESYNIEKPSAGELAQLGADVPVSFLGTTALMEGVGEELRPSKLDNDYGIVLVNPLKAVSTKAVFDRLTNYDKSIEYKEIYSLDNLLHQSNTMQSTAISICPEISTILDKLQRERPLLARMTGSGATCFALVKKGEEVDFAKAIEKRLPQFWVQATQTKRSTT